MNGLTLPTPISLLKNALKLTHGGLYRLLLTVIVRPPMIWYKGGVYSIPRVAIIRFIESWRDRIHGKVLDVGVGGWSFPRQLLEKVCDYTATDCFEHPNVDQISDIHHLTDKFAPGTFDFVLCTDVLEHVSRPWEAVRQLAGVLKPDGTLLLTTPFNYHLHGNQTTPDYWRLSADGLRVLLIEFAGFEQVDITPIGHPEYPFCHTVVARKTVTKL